MVVLARRGIEDELCERPGALDPERRFSRSRDGPQIRDIVGEGCRPCLKKVKRVDIW